MKVKCLDRRIPSCESKKKRIKFSRRYLEYFGITIDATTRITLSQYTCSPSLTVDRYLVLKL